MSACPVCGKRMKSAQGLADHQRSTGHFAPADAIDDAADDSASEQVSTPVKQVDLAASADALLVVDLTLGAKTESSPSMHSHVQSPAVVAAGSPASLTAVKSESPPPIVVGPPASATYSPTVSSPLPSVVADAAPVAAPLVDEPVADSWAPLSLADELAINDEEERRVRQVIIGEADVLLPPSPARDASASPVAVEPVAIASAGVAPTSLDSVRCSQCALLFALDQVASHQCPRALPPIKADACTLC